MAKTKSKETRKTFKTFATKIKHLSTFAAVLNSRHRVLTRNAGEMHYNYVIRLGFKGNLHNINQYGHHLHIGFTPLMAFMIQSFS